MRKQLEEIQKELAHAELDLAAQDTAGTPAEHLSTTKDQIGARASPKVGAYNKVQRH